MFLLYTDFCCAETGRLVKGILAPFIYGLVMAYLLCQYTIYSAKRLWMLTRGGDTKGTFCCKGRRYDRVARTPYYCDGGILWMIIPGLIDSIVKIIDVLPESMSRLMEWADMKLQNFRVAQS